MLHINIVNVETPEEMGKAAADVFEAVIHAKPACVMGLATGSTPLPLYRELIARDAFVEYEEVYRDRYYGTLKSEVDRIWAKGKVIIFDVDVKGGYNLKKYFGDSALSVLIVPPSLEVLEQRLRGRGTDSEEAITERLGKAGSELEFAKGKFDIELVNDKLEDTFAAAEAAIDGFLCA